MADGSPPHAVAQNRRARFDYFINESLEAGLVLTGSEVKSIRARMISINESFAGEMEGELYLFNAHIHEYTQANRMNHEPRRPRKLLVKKRELNKLLGAVRRKGVTLIPMACYFNPKGFVKLQLGLATGKRKVDKRADEKEKDWKRDKARLMRDKG